MIACESEQLEGPWVGYAGASDHTTLSTAWLRKLVMEKKIPFRKVGRRVLFSLPALDRWVSSNPELVAEASVVEPAA